jgi:hypothetical protein
MKSPSDRVEALERTALRHDKRIQSIRSLIEQGMRIVVRNAAEQRELRASVKELVTSLKGRHERSRQAKGGPAVIL